MNKTSNSANAFVQQIYNIPSLHANFQKANLHLRMEASSNLPGDFLQDICNSTKSNLNLDTLMPCHDLTPDHVNSVITQEMAKVMAQYSADEEAFVNQQLKDNPIVCERRPSTRSGSESSSSNRDPLQQQRAESCRRSRINNKIKKAKSKYRHKFVTMKLAQNVATLECIRDVISHAEAKLLRSGFSEAALEKLRKTMGIDKMEIDNLTEMTKNIVSPTEK